MKNIQIYFCLAAALILSPLLSHAGILRSASQIGVNIVFEATVPGSTCDDIWVNLKTTSNPEFKSLQSLGGSKANANPCRGSKNIYGEEEDVTAFVDKIKTKYESLYQLLFIPINTTRITGSFNEDTTGLFHYNFDRTFETFDELLDFLNRFKTSTAIRLPKFMEDYFNATEYAGELQEHFNNLNCLHGYTLSTRIYATNGSTSTKVANKNVTLVEICP